MSEKLHGMYYRARVIVDGAFYRSGASYYSYGEEKGRIDPLALLNFLQDEVAKYLNVDPGFVYLNVMFYDGQMFSSKSERMDQKIHQQMSDAGMTLRLFPLVKRRVGGKEKWVQKRISEEMICETLMAACKDEFDVLVLFSGDGKLVPLVRSVQDTRKPVLAAYFDIDEWEDSRGSWHRKTTISQDLLDIVSEEIDISKAIEEGEDLF